MSNTDRACGLFHRLAGSVVAACCASALAYGTVPSAPIGADEPEVRVEACTSRVRAGDFLLLKYAIHNPTPNDVEMIFEPDYMDGTVGLEARSNPKDGFTRLKPVWSSFFGETNVGPLTVSKGVTYVGFAPLFSARDGKLVISDVGDLELRVDFPFKKHGIIRSQALRVTVAGTPSEDEKLIRKHQWEIIRAMDASFDSWNDLEAVRKLENSLGDSGVKSLLHVYGTLLAYFRGTGFELKDDFKPLVERLRRESGACLTDFLLQNTAQHFVNIRQWKKAADVLVYLPERNCRVERLHAFVRFNLKDGGGR